jgi:energy-coupling factor transporter ATP-binding protein EcfA2
MTMVPEEIACRLADAELDDEARAAVAAAFGGPEAVDAWLAGTGSFDPGPGGSGPEPDGDLPDAIYLRSITVEGFRGVGAAAELELEPGPGFTLVVGRNGSGKSSFAEAAELAVTGSSARWANKRAKVWKDGWRNLHHPNARIELALLAEGFGRPITIRQRWQPDAADPDESTAWIEQDGRPPRKMPPPAWEQALGSFRPFLSYSELARMLEEGPSKSYDALAAVLGLDDVVAATKELDGRRKEIQKRITDAMTVGRNLRAEAEAHDDERAAPLAAAVPKRGANVDRAAIRAVLAGAAVPTRDAAAEALVRSVLDARTPAPTAVAATTADLRAAAADAAEHAGTDADRAHRTADLLREALRFHDHVGAERCPVCDSDRALDDAWRSATETTVRDLDAAASAAKAAKDRLAGAERAARSLARQAPAFLVVAPGRDPADAPIDVEAARAAWERFAALPDEPTALADHLDATVDAVAATVTELQADAERWLAERQDRWQPLAEAFAAWLPEIDEALAHEVHVDPLKRAGEWLAAVGNDLRDERFRPIRERTIALWEQMRCRSNVTVESMNLAGTATRRRVDLDIAVDGAPGAALGVMSQGELNTLALAMFLPRAVADDSPFRFVLVDDPVQAMDPARVEGMAQAFSSVAADRQVVVFTHDDRLPEACRRLGLPVRVIEVSRRDGSKVAVAETDVPQRRYLKEAATIVSAKVPPAVAEVVVPNLLRQAIEATGHQVLRRRWLARGVEHHQVEERLADAVLVDIMSHIVFDRVEDERKVVYDEVGRRFGHDAETAMSETNAGSHNGHRGDLRDLIDRTRTLVRALEATR